VDADGRDFSQARPLPSAMAPSQPIVLPVAAGRRRPSAITRKSRGGPALGI
jgi:hypothetical protein